MNSMIKIGYVPVDPSLKKPGDYRRFSGYAKCRRLQFEEARWGEKYDLVVLSCGADISTWVNYEHGKVVYDLIDSYLSIPSTDIKGLFRGLAKYAARQHKHLKLNYWQALREMCIRADAVVCTTQEQRSSIQPYCKNVHIILDLHSEVVLTTKENYKASSPFKFVWEGLPSNLPQLETIADTVKKIAKNYPIEIHVVTDMEGRRFLGKFGTVSSEDTVKSAFEGAIVHAWDNKTFSKIIAECDAAIIPINLQDNFALGKPANKLLLLWRIGMPVIASATPAYTKAMNEAGVPLVCEVQDDWLKNLEKIILDHELRQQSGQCGLKYVDANWNEAQIIERWDNVFKSIGFDFSKEKYIEGLA